MALTVGGGAVLAALAGPLGHLMTGAAVPPVLVLGWVAYLAAWAAGLPAVSELVARRRSRQVFQIRGVDALLGLALVTVVLMVLDGPTAGGPAVGGSAAVGVTAVPWLMALGGCYAVWRLLRLRRCDRSPWSG